MRERGGVKAHPGQHKQRVTNIIPPTAVPPRSPPPSGALTLTARSSHSKSLKAYLLPELVLSRRAPRLSVPSFGPDRIVHHPPFNNHDWVFCPDSLYSLLVEGKEAPFALDTHRCERCEQCTSKSSPTPRHLGLSTHLAYFRHLKFSTCCRGEPQSRVPGVPFPLFSHIQSCPPLAWRPTRLRRRRERR